MKTRHYQIPFLLFMISLISLACQVPFGKSDKGSDSPTPLPAPTSVATLRQWASKARASSQYSDPNWAASQATGAPNVKNCLDDVNAWASSSSSGKDWIELTYDTPVYPSEINIHISYNPSQVVDVQIIDVNDKAYSVLKTDPVEVTECPYVLQISFDQGKKVLAKKVKIFIDQSVLGLGWNEIDAVELVGQPGEGGAMELPSEPPSIDQPKASVNSPYQPGDLEPGSFAYDVTGYENDTIKGNNVVYQSTDLTYVVGLISNTGRYVVSLFLPTTGLEQGAARLIPYAEASESNKLTAVIAINAFLYISDSGEIDVQSDPNTGRFTGVFSFDAHSKDFADRSVVVAGAVNDIPLQ